MDPRSRAALIRRVAAVLGADAPFPGDWAELSLTEQLAIECADPVAASVLKGTYSADIELQLLEGNFSAVAPAVPTRQESRDEAVAAAFAGLGELRGIDQLEAERNAALADQAQARANSLVQAHGSWQ